MVTSVSSFGRSGVQDFLIQRVSAIILLLDVLLLSYVFITNPDLQYQDWRTIFDQTWVKVFSVISVLALVAHAWIGIWTVATDYLTPMMLGKSASTVRLIVQLVVVLTLFVYLIWCIQILWSI